MRGTIASRLANDATLAALLTGGVHTSTEITRQDTPTAFDANGEIKPCALVKVESESPTGPYESSGRLFVVVYVYERTGTATIDAALDRIFALLHLWKPTGAWETRHADDVRDAGDQALECRAGYSRYVMTRLRDNDSETMALASGAGWFTFGLPFWISSVARAQDLIDLINAQNGAGSCTEVDAWVSGAWSAHVDGLPFDNFDIAPGNGYLVKTTKACALEFSGRRFASDVVVTLGAGHTFIAPFRTGYTAESLASAINAQGGACVAVGQVNSDGSVTYYTIGSGAGDFDIERGRGYMVECPAGSVFRMEA